jgi:predicted nicotinamide N-methyase
MHRARPRRPYSAFRTPRSAFAVSVPAPGRHARRLARLRARLARRFPVRAIEITLPRSGSRYRLLVPADQDRLLDQAEADPEQNLPYWAEVWPSGVALADVALERREDLAGRPVLELGSGLGVTAAAALAAGARLLAVDYSPDALVLCRYNALRNAGREPRTLELNWRAPSAALFALAAEARGFPVILAADVLYEERDVAPLLDLVGKLLAPGGAVWLAEPRRESARRFLAAADAAGWRRATEEYDGPWPEGNATVRVHILHPPEREG